MEMTMTSAQKTSDSTPSTCAWVGSHRVRTVEAFANRVEGAGADVAVDDAKRDQTEHGEVTALRS